MGEIHLEMHRGCFSRAVVAVAGTLDFASSVQFRLALYDLLDTGFTEVTVDLAAVRVLDASAVGVLLQVAELLQERDGTIRVIGATGLVQDVLEITGAAKTLAGERTVDPGAGAAAGGHRWSPARDDELKTMLSTAKALPAHDPVARRLRRRVIEAYLPMVQRLARRFYGLGEPAEDLDQVAALGLVQAFDRFDPAFATDFASFAVPTVMGELKRHFRDKGWSVHVPRRLKELRLEVNRSREILAQELGRMPTRLEIAGHLGVSAEAVGNALVAAGGYRAVSLHAPVYPQDADSVVALDRLGVHDEGFDAVELRQTVFPLLAGLPLRERRILSLRFYGNLTQAQIADRLGISQMHVSRLLGRALNRLHQRLAEYPCAGGPTGRD